MTQVNTNTSLNGSKAKTRRSYKPGKYHRAKSMPVSMRKEAADLMSEVFVYKEVARVMNKRHLDLGLTPAMAKSLIELYKQDRYEEMTQSNNAAPTDLFDVPKGKPEKKEPTAVTIDTKGLASMLKDASDLRDMSAEFIEKYGVRHQDVLSMIGK